MSLGIVYRVGDCRIELNRYSDMTKHVFEKVTSVEVTGDYQLRVHFSHGVSRDIDLEPILQGGIYGALRDKELFAKVSLDSEVGVVCWPNGADFDSSILYQWDDVKEELLQTITTSADLDLAGR